MGVTTAIKMPVELEVLQQTADLLNLRIAGRLDAMTTAYLWENVQHLITDRTPQACRLDAAALTYCDGSGMALLAYMQEQQTQHGGSFEVVGLMSHLQDLFDAYTGGGEHTTPPPPQTRALGWVEYLGVRVSALADEIYAQVAFVGELMSSLMLALAHPRRIRWKDVTDVMESGCVNALPITMMIGFLVGLIMAFQAAIPMRQFGAEIFVADLIALSVLRELGPLMTAVILSGRTGSAFAAEIGTMKVNEELNALHTMGLDPVWFLVVSRMLGMIALVPLLTIFTSMAGLAGGAVVMRALGFPLVTYLNQIALAVGVHDVLGGLVKAFAFGFIIVAVGCLRGLQTRSGASAVGSAATRAVVGCLVLLIVVDGIFSVVYYYMGI